MDLHTRYLGLALRSLLVASASPLTGDLDGLRRLEEAGAGAVVLPSLFEEQIGHELAEIDRMFSGGRPAGPGEPTYPRELDEYNAGLWTYLALAEKARKTLSIPVIGSLNGTSLGGWVRHATRLQETGVDAIEFNLFDVVADPAVGAAEALLAGADVAMLASALLLHGPEHLRTVERQLVACLRGCGIASPARARGMLSQRDVPDPTAFERANYPETLASHARPARR
jgi:dihydroorotate dehydrogenase